MPTCRASLLTIFSAVSLVLLALLAIVWLRSWFPEDMRWGVVDGNLVIMFSRNAYTAEADRLYFTSHEMLEVPGTGGRGFYPASVGLRELLQRLRKGAVLLPNDERPFHYDGGRLLGVTWTAAAHRPPSLDLRNQYCAAAVPLAWLLLPLAVLPAWWGAVAWRRARRRRRRLCEWCGYDLRESPQRCPECGTSVTAVGRASE